MPVQEVHPSFRSRCGSATFKHEALKERLLNLIAKAPAGTRIPTVREIMGQYNVSKATVSKALDDLKDNGYVEATVGRGTFVRERLNGGEALKLRRVDLLFFNDAPLGPPSFHNEVVNHIGRYLGQQDAWMRTTVLPFHTTLTETISQIEELNPEAVLLDNLQDSHVMDVVFRRQIPFVAIFPTLSKQSSNSFLIDNHSVVRQQVSHLLELGHRKIAFLHCVSDQYHQRDHVQRLQFFYEEFAHAGIVPDPHLIRYSGFEKEGGARVTKELLAEGREFTAIICGDTGAPGVYGALAEAGLQVGKDISVVGVDDCDWAAKMDPPLATVRIPRDRLAKRAVNKLQELVTKKDYYFENELVQTELIVRESTAPPKLNN